MGNLKENKKTTKKYKGSSYKDSNLFGYLFILPMFIGILIFVVIPVIYAFVLSFSKWNLIGEPEWVQFKNYITIFKDPLFKKTLFNTFYFTAVNVPVKLSLALLFAVMLNQKIKGAVLYRSIYFMPVITSVVAVSIVWGGLYNADFGIINYALSLFGIHGPNWIGSTKWAMPSVIIMSIWQNMGYAIVIYLAGLQSFDSALGEAASIDGANSWTTFWKIKFPLLSATTFFLIITNVISSLQVFTEMFILTNEGPVDATNVMSTYIYDLAFRFNKIGVASAASMVLFLIIGVITLIQFKGSRWVHYE